MLLNVVRLAQVALHSFKERVELRSHGGSQAHRCVPVCLEMSLILYYADASTLQVEAGGNATGTCSTMIVMSYFQVIRLKL